jgi:N-acetylmuramoyl-L-alanine amidase
MEDDYIQKYDGYDPDSPEGHIILSMYQNAYLDQSILFADCIERQFVNGLARKSRGVKQAGFLVLRTTTMPSVLVEAGFLSHDNDEAFLGNKENHETIARSIFNAFAEYRAILEGLLPEDGGPLTASTMPVAQNSNPKPTVPETPPAVKPTPPQPSTPAKPAVVVATTPPKSKPADASIPVKTTPVKPLDISFYVQLAASKAALPPSVTNWKTNVAIERLQEDGYYKYLAGPFKDIEQANVALTDIRQKDSKDAFVVAYRDKQRISVKDAIAALQ